ncbi:MAG TPA: thiamine pyrophosphate-dependent enzyme, partial [Actinomycetota bacterium]
NNGWAISMPTAQQTAGEIWKRAEGYGFPGVRVDGNDVLAVYRATKEAADRARAGGGPTLIEALTYRIGAHSTADDPSRYRDDTEVEVARAFDPIARFRTWLTAGGTVDDATVESWEQEIDAEVLAIREGVVAQAAPPVEAMFDHAYAAPTAQFERMRGEALSD